MAKNYLDIIKSQRKEKKKEKFEGTFLEYLSLVEKDPALADHAHKRLYESITEKGVESMDDSDPRKHKIFGGDNIKTYNYFQSEFFGMESVIAKLMRFLRSAALKGEESRQVARNRKLGLCLMSNMADCVAVTLVWRSMPGAAEAAAVWAVEALAMS